MATKRVWKIEILDEDEVRAMIAACGKGPAGVRDAALIAVLYRSGLRISEALALLPRDIDTKSGVVTVHDGKGDKRRHSHIGPVWMSLVEKWLTKRRAIGLTGRQPLFCTISSGVRKGKTLEPGRPLHQAQVRALLRRLGKRADIEKRVHPHGLRHAFAVDLVRSGKALKPIQDVLGHSRLQTTEEYLRVLSPEESLRHIAEGRD